MELKLFWDVLTNFYCKSFPGSTRLMTGINRLGLHCRVPKLGLHSSLPGGGESIRCTNILQRDIQLRGDLYISLSGSGGAGSPLRLFWNSALSLNMGCKTQVL